MAKLGVNIDHVATLRQARRGKQPDPVEAAMVCEKAGCHSIVAHLREDRRHINDADVKRLKERIRTRFNLEMSVADEIVKIACAIKPHQATLVPEKRQEITTEGGLDVAGHKKRIAKTISVLESCSIEVSLFIDPQLGQIKAAKEAGSRIIEIHTGRYANASRPQDIEREFKAIKTAVSAGLDLGMTVNAGHGLDYSNTRRIAMINGIHELNIGHSIISYAVFAGLQRAVKEMLALAR